MNILYGIQLNGNGHITRSIEIIRNLIDKSFNVDIVVSGNNYSLELPFKVKDKFRGLSLYYDTKGKINWMSSIKDARIKQLVKDVKYDVSKYDLVLSDFEPVTAWSAHLQNKKCINISNQNSLLSNKSPKFKKEFIASTFLKYFAYSKNRIGLHYKSYDNNIYQPIISNNLQNSNSVDNDFILVYLPAYDINLLKSLFRSFKQVNWMIFSNSVKTNIDFHNISLRPINFEKFQENLIKCSGVITASGFTTTSEALVLNKKLWSIPIKGQYEQVCNSKALMDMGIFTKEMTYENIENWISNYNPINYQWVNPMESIVNNIVKVYEN
jgi:uncharacterized protein (TIGR00661 family)